MLDARQIKRIEAVHGGFLYQHLYAVGCLFLAAKAGASAVVVERDEDIEIETGAQRVYVQVKTRSAPILPSDIDDVLRRFSQLRMEHVEGRREGGARIVIIVNRSPSPDVGDVPGLAIASSLVRELAARRVEQALA